MITVQKEITFLKTYPLERIGRLDELLFFDIETTGFSGDYSALYLIGCVWFEQGSWHLVQWFADTAGAEAELLDSFFTFMKRFRTLVHFNGDGFDIPYLLKRCSHLGLPYDFSAVQSFDIYKKCRPYRRILGMDSMKQKAIEQFLGVSRKDKYSGGDLIEVYHEYLMTRDKYLYHLLMLHNEDDLKGMPSILPILNYPDFFERPLVYVNHETTHVTDFFGSRQPQLSITAQGSSRLPVPLELEHEPVFAHAEEDLLTVTVAMYEGTLKHFYPNYRDYYYLPFEDTAIHKSVGEYVDKDARQKATAKTCYTRKSGCFLPQFSPLWTPEMKMEPRDKISYAPLENVCLQDESCRQAYLTQLLRYLGLRP